MELQIFSMYDKKTCVYGRPFYAHNDGHAIRCVQDEVDREDSQLAKYPSDFCLCSIGSFSDDCGALVGSDVRVVIEVSKLVRKGQPDG